MKIILLLVIAIHGLIHLAGFLKAFEWVDFEQLEDDMPGYMGVFWLLAFLLFAVTGTLYFLNNDYWWLPGMLAILTSQALIFNYWDDAKFGSIANLILLIAVILSYAQFNFNLQFERQSQQLLIIEDRPAPEVYSAEDWHSLPGIVQKWLLRSGIENNEQIQTVQLSQKARMKLEEDAEEWVNATAMQTVQTLNPAFIWVANIEVFPIIDVQAKDSYLEGQGEMIVKGHSLLTLEHLSENKKLDTASLQRYLSEMVLYPSAALDKYITWDSISTLSATANIYYKGVKTSGTFTFSEEGDFLQFTTDRYLDPSSDADPIPWTITASNYKEISGWRIPVSYKVTWTTDKGPWNWLQLEIENITYNL